MNTETKTSPIQVDAQDGRDVVFTPLNEDRFVLTCQQAVEAVSRGIGESVRADELKGLISHIREWSLRREDSVSASFMALRDAQLVIFVAAKADQYDDELADELTELDVQLAQKFQYFDCDVAQIPDDTPIVLAAFMDNTKALCLYPADEPTSST